MSGRSTVLLAPTVPGTVCYGTGGRVPGSCLGRVWFVGTTGGFWSWLLTYWFST